MIFIGQPNLFVKFANKVVLRATGKKGFYFDENGRYKTDHEFLINVLKQHFKYEENAIEGQPKSEEIKLKHCKKCDFTTDSQGLLMAHYKGTHPKDR